MGFKESSDGRVYFSTSNNNDAPDVKPLTKGKMSGKRPEMLSDSDQTQAQILGVLKSVNERLRITKEERDQMRRDLDNYKELVKTLHAKTVKTEKILDEGGGGLSDKRYDAIHDKMVNALSKTAQLERKVDKFAQERDRIMRKMERIENQVIKTHEMLSAGGAALLTDQSKGADITANEVSPRFLLEDEYELQPWWKRSKALSVLAVIGLFAGGIVGGWAINNAQQPIDLPPLTVNSQNYTGPDQGVAITPPQQSFADIVAEDGAMFAPEAATGSAIELAPAPETNNTQPAIDLNDDAALEEAMDSNPEALAVELNKIEPSAPPPPQEAAPKIVEAPTFQGAPETAAAAIEPPTASPDISANKVQVKDINPDNDLPQVVKEIEAQAFAGVPEAQHDLAAIYTAGHGGVEQNYERAAMWFAKAAESGVGNAAYNLGVLHHQGIGVKPDLGKAIDWYGKAAALDHPEAQYNLGIAYVEGIGVSYDPERATNYFKSAAMQGIMEAAYNLGLIYENGLLGAPKPEEALIWYKAAADQGSPEAQAALEQLARNLDISMDKVNEIVGGMQIIPAQQSGGNQGADQAAQDSVVRISGASAQNAALTEEVQKQLMRIGLYPGPADGLDGQLTQDAIRSYQAVHDLSLDGNASQALLDHLLLQSVSASSLNN